jgi:hypothetical protein
VEIRRAAVVGASTYGESAPAPVLFKHFSSTAENVVAVVHQVLEQVAGTARFSSPLPLATGAILMTIKIGINGFRPSEHGVPCAAVQRTSRRIDIVSINDLLEPNTSPYMPGNFWARCGRFRARCPVDGNTLIVNGRVRLTRRNATRRPEVGRCRRRLHRRPPPVPDQETGQKHLDAGGEESHLLGTVEEGTLRRCSCSA